MSAIARQFLSSFRDPFPLYISLIIPRFCDAIRMLKPYKTDGVEAATSDILIHACPELYIHLCALFNVTLWHGVCPSNMCISTLIPIPKCKNKSLNDSNNYRAIALGSVVAKVIDNIILVKYKDILISDELQFGFKKDIQPFTVLLF